MADKNFVDYDNLKLYDNLIKNYLTQKDEVTLQSAKAYINAQIGDYQEAFNTTYATVAKAILGETARAEAAMEWKTLGSIE